MDNKDTTSQSAGTTPPPVSKSINLNNFVSLVKKFKLPIIGLTLILVLGAGSLVLLRPKESPLGKEFLTAYQASDFEKAEGIAREKLGEKPDDPRIIAAVIDTISLQGNQKGTEKAALADSQPYIDSLINSAPEELSTLMTVGYAYETAGEYEKANEYYQKATEKYPSDPDAWFHYGHNLQFVDQGEESREAIAKSYELDPDNPLAAISMGNDSLQKGDSNKAKEFYLKAASSDKVTSSTKAEALAAAATVARNQYQFNEALKLAKEAYETSPTFSPAVATYGYMLALTGKNQEGAALLNEAVRLNPRITKNKYMLGHVLRANKDYAGAINVQKLAISELSNDNTVLTDVAKNGWKGIYTYELAKTYSMAGINTDTIPLLSEAVTLNPTTIESIKGDVNSGFFSELSTNPEFLNLINP